MADTRGMLARLRKLERSHGATDEMRDWISENFGAAVADGRMCPADGPVVLHCLLNWISDGTARSGIAGEGLLR
ncbi:MAG: hypothetical protein ACK561_25625 [Pseudomonadaceae bacterium]